MQASNHNSQNRIYSISKLTREIKTLLEQKFPFVWVNGEISNFSVPVSGHFYFTLKDENAQISAVMFRGQNRLLKFKPEDGMQVVGLGRLSVYEPRGAYQVIFELLEPEGVGAHQVAFEQLKTKLQKEGLFDEKHKCPLPYLPRKISVITSPTGAVVHDIVQVITRRFPGLALEILPVKVQGDQAVGEITAALELLNDRHDADVAILARGGGSLEDLAAFNAEEVARKVFASKIPIVSAVGHETDFTISDFVADLRAPTPSAAAELVVPVKADLERLCRGLHDRLSDGMTDLIRQNAQWVEALTLRLSDPRRKIQDLALGIDDLAARLIRLTRNTHRLHCERLHLWSDRLMANTPLSPLHLSKEKLDILNNKLQYYLKIFLKQKKSRLRECQAGLQALNPKSILQRGFSITRTIPDAAVVRDSASVDVGQALELLLARGTLTCRVEGKQKHGEENV